MSSCHEGQCIVGHAGEYSSYCLYDEEEFFEDLNKYAYFVQESLQPIEGEYSWIKDYTKKQEAFEYLVLNKVFSYCPNCGRDIKTIDWLRKVEPLVMSQIEKMEKMFNDKQSNL